MYKYLKQAMIHLQNMDEKKKYQVCMAAVIIIAAIRYFYKLLSRPCFYYDEVYELKVVQGLWNTGKLYEWDYINNCLSETPYTRAWPYTYLLFGWMKIFGFSLLSARALSAIIGIAFMVSVFYVVEKMVNRNTALFTVILLLANNDVSYVFRFVRMYGLWLLLCLWGMHFLYLALTEKNNFSRNSMLTHIIVRYVDYNMAYMALAVLFLVFACFVHMNTFMIFAAAIAFIVFEALIKREKKYIIVSILCFGGLLSLGIPFLYRNIPFLSTIHSIISFHTKIDEFLGSGYSLIENCNKAYIDYFFTQVGYKAIIILGLLAFLGAFLDKRYPVKKAYLRYQLSMLIVGIAFMALLADRYFKERYIMCFIVCWDVLLAVGFDYIFSQWKKHVKIIFSVALMVCLLVNIYQGREIYKQSDCGNFIPAYQKMLETANKDEIVPIISAQFMGYYYNQVSEGYKSDILDIGASKISYDTIIQFSEKYPTGYIAIDDNKFKLVEEGVQYFIRDWLDKVAGDGMDDYAVQIGRYCIIKPAEKEEKVYSYENDSFYYNYAVKDDIIKWDILWKEDMLPEDAGLICLKLIGIDDKGAECIHAVQLKVSDRDNLQYSFPVSCKEDVDSCRIEETFSYFTREGKFLEEKIMNSGS